MRPRRTIGAGVNGAGSTSGRDDAGDLSAFFGPPQEWVERGVGRGGGAGGREWGEGGGGGVQCAKATISECSEILAEYLQQ